MIYSVFFMPLFGQLSPYKNQIFSKQVPSLNEIFPLSTKHGIKITTSGQNASEDSSLFCKTK